MKHTWFPAKYGLVLVVQRGPKAFFNQLKELVPETERRYDRDRRGWWISDGWLWEVRQLIAEHEGA